MTDEKLSFENVSSLRTLVGISTSSLGFSRFAQMTSLTKLKLHHGKDWDRSVTFNNLRSLTVIRDSLTTINQNIEPIILSCPRVQKLKVVVWIEKLPEHSRFSPDLVKLTLKDTRYCINKMPTLEKLPKVSML